MNIDSTTIDRIVADVLAKMSTVDNRATAVPAVQSGAVGVSTNASQKQTTPSTTKSFDIDLSHVGVITGEMLESLKPGAAVRTSKSVVLTPTARDLIKKRNLRMADTAPQNHSARENKSSLRPHLLVVTSTPETRTLADNLKSAGWQIDYPGCDGDAIKAARSAICRGESNFVAIIAPKPNRTAQRLNRTRNVLAAAVLPEINVNELIAEGHWNVACLSAERWASFRLRKTLEQLVGQASPDAAVQQSSNRKGGA